MAKKHVDFNKPNAVDGAVHRDGRLLICRVDPQNLAKINEGIRFCYRLAAVRNPSATPPPPVTAAFMIHNKDPDSLHQLLVHRLDYRPNSAKRVGEVITFSKPQHAASCAKSLQLGTPASYRDQDQLPPGLRDHHDGMVTKDARQWARKVLREGNVHGASLSFAATREPWVLCASHFRSRQELHRLEKHFADKYGYTAGTRIGDPDAFALWLGIDFALSLKQATLVKLSAPDKFGYEKSSCRSTFWEGSRPFDSFVHVYHGPVNYKDIAGQINSQEQWFDPHAGPVAWFTKKRAFQAQSEYRFAVSTLGDPIQPRLHIAISPELRDITVKGRSQPPHSCPSFLRRAS